MSPGTHGALNVQAPNGGESSIGGSTSSTGYPITNTSVGSSSRVSSHLSSTVISGGVTTSVASTSLRPGPTSSSSSSSSYSGISDTSIPVYSPSLGLPSPAFSSGTASGSSSVEHWGGHRSGPGKSGGGRAVAGMQQDTKAVCNRKRRRRRGAARMK